LATNIESPFDLGVQAIATAYDPLGRVETVTQYDDTAMAGTDLLDQVKFAYDDWGNIEAVQQNHTHAVGAGGTDYDISYTYAKSAGSGKRQAIRRTGMTLPGGQAIAYGYAGLNDSLSRVS